MIETVEQLKKERSDLVEEFEKMNIEQLLNQCYLESIDAINMENRVELFMRECTCGMSKTTYSLETLEKLISERKEQDIAEFCYDETADKQSDEEIANRIREKAEELDF